MYVLAQRQQNCTSWLGKITGNAICGDSLKILQVLIAQNYKGKYCITC